MLRALILFGAGYVLGAKAGRERYAQIEDIAKRVTDEFSRRQAPTTPTSAQT